MKKIISMILALTMILTLFVGCGTTAAPTSDPVDDTVEVTPTATPTTVEGVVKEASLAKITVTLADGTTIAFDTTGITGLEVGLGDTVKVEYAGEIGSLVATSVTVTEKAEIPTATVTGVVTKIEDGFVFLTLEDGSEAALKIESVEEYDVEVGDTLTVEYVDTDTEDGVDVVSVEVTKAEKVEEEAPVAETTAPAVGSQSGNFNASGNAGNTGNASNGATGSAQASQVSTKKADYTVTAVVTGFDKALGATIFKQSNGSESMIGGAEDIAEGLNGRKFQVGDEVVIGYTGSGMRTSLAYITLVKAAGSSTTIDDWDDDDYYYDDDDGEGYTFFGEVSSSGSGSSKSENDGDVYEAIRLINAERVKNGVPELEIDSDLMAMAAVRAEEQVESFGHTRPDGRTPDSIFDDFGSNLQCKGENATAVGYVAKDAVNAWIKSSEHHKIMLMDSATKIGVGFCYDSNSKYKHYWIMLLAK